MEIISFAVVVAIVVGITQAIKMTKVIPSKYGAIVALVVGVVLVGLYSGFTTDSLLQGLIAGLSAAGIWSGVKSTIS